MTTVTSDHILNACRVAFPQRRGLAIEGLRRLEGGQHEIVAFHLSWEDAGGRRSDQTLPLVFRHYRGLLGWYSLGDAHKAAREFAVLRWLGANRFPAPLALAHGEDEAGPYLLMSTVGGRNWWLPLGGVNFEKALPGIVRQHVDLLTRLHGLDAEPLRDEAAHIPTVTVMGVLDSCRAWANESGDGPLLDAVNRLGSLLEAIEERPARLINMDASVSNLLVDVPTGQNVVAWIDWEDAALGDPRWDIVRLAADLRGAYQMDALAAQAIGWYEKARVTRVDGVTAWTALYAVVRWTQCVWLQVQIEDGQKVEFPGWERFIGASDSHRAWALETLAEAEEGEA